MTLARILKDLERLTGKETQAWRNTEKDLTRLVRRDIDGKLAVNLRGAPDIVGPSERPWHPTGPKATPVAEVPAPSRPPAARYKTIEVDPEFIGEDKPGNTVYPGQQVKYLTEEERRRYEIRVIDEKLYDSDNKLYDTTKAKSLFWGSKSSATFVMDAEGRLYSSLISEAGVFQHSSYLAGGPVAGAGTIRVEKGVLKELTNESGHYKPNRAMTIQVAQRLHELGVPMRDVDVLVFRAIYRPNQR
ncbi:hypothetical protein ACWCPQ_27865 [Nocardia sp. NPDC001965]